MMASCMMHTAIDLFTLNLLIMQVRMAMSGSRQKRLLRYSCKRVKHVSP